MRLHESGRATPVTPQYNSRMATTTATVIPQGLALTPDFMAEHDLTPGTSVVVTVGEAPRKVSVSIDQLIREMRGCSPKRAEEWLKNYNKCAEKTSSDFKRNGDLRPGCESSIALS